MLIAALALAVGAVGGAYLYFHQSVATVRAHTPDVVRAEKSLDIPVAHHAAIALVIGYDHRAGEAVTDPSRSDTVMLIRADPVTKSISLLSFPRDLGVPIYCGASPITVDRINSAYSRCGVKGTLLTGEASDDLKINYLITVNFHGFKEVVDKLGGVWMDIDRRYYNRNTGAAYDNYANIDLQPGYQKLTGGQALDFVRFRHTDYDFYRLARQQQFVRAFKEQVAQSFDFTSSPSSSTRSSATSRSPRAVTSCRAARSLSYAFFAKDLPGGHFFQPKIEGVNGLSVTCGADRRDPEGGRRVREPGRRSRRRRRTPRRSAGNQVEGAAAVEGDACSC